MTVSVALACGLGVPALAVPGLISGSSVLPYLGAASSEAILTFVGKVQFTSKKEPTESLAREKIEDQLSYINGPLEAGFTPKEPKKHFVQIEQTKPLPMAVPKGAVHPKHVLYDIQWKKIGTGKDGDIYEAEYAFEGEMIVKNAKSTFYRITLPKRPDLIYQSAVTSSTVSGMNMCSDNEHQMESSFKSVWNPDYTGCKLKEGSDYQKFDAFLWPSNPAPKTYPEYHRLPGTDGVIRMKLVFGMFQAAKTMNSMISDDLGAIQFRKFREEIKKDGFVRDEAQSKVLPEYTTELWSKKTPKGRTEIELFFGVTHYQLPQAIHFHRFYQKAAKEGALIIYNGHAGFGSNVHPDAIKKASNIDIEFDPSRYQMVFLNGCSTYGYYRDLYLQKKSAKNIDLIATAIPALFKEQSDASIKVVRAVDAWTHGKPAPDYIDLTKVIGTQAIVGVHGADDNPTTLTP